MCPTRDTPRTLFKFAGYLRSVAPIIGWERYRLGTITKAQSALGEVDWENEGDTEPQDPRLRAKIAEAIAEAKYRILSIPEDPHPRHKASHLALLRKARERVHYVAVDATLDRYAVYAFARDGTVSLLETLPFVDEKGIVCRVPHIDIGEAHAMRRGVQLSKQSGALMVFIVGDNQSADYAFFNGYSPTDEVNDEVAQAGYIHDTGLTVIIGDIEGIDNVADVATRPDEIFHPDDIARRTKATWIRLRQTEEYWKRTTKGFLKRDVAKDINVD